MKRVVIFGTGEGARRAWYQAADRVDVEVVAFADNDPRKAGTLFFERPVRSGPQLAKSTDWDLIWLASQWHAEIRKGLVELGVTEERMLNVDFPAPETYETSAERMDRAIVAYAAGLAAEGGDSASPAVPPRKELELLFGTITTRLDDRAFLDGFLPAEEPRQWEEIRGAVRFLQEALAGLPGAAERMATLSGLAVLRPKNRAVLVVWAEELLALGRAEEAAAKARHALSIFYNDVHTQRLFLRCTGEKDLFAEAGDRFCPQPFRDLEIIDNGATYICNCTWLPFPVGNALQQTPAGIWRSPTARILRESVLDGSFRFCSPMTCPMRFNLPKRAEKPELMQRLRAVGVDGAGGWPAELSLSYDRSCNLSCPSCRERLTMANHAERAMFDGLRDRVVLPLLKTAEYVYITGSGDPFGSAHFRDLLRRLCDPSFAHLELHLMTNGLLLTPRVWNELAPLHSRIRLLTVSIDGATPATYSRLRRGGSLAQVERAMELLAEQRRRKTLRHLVVNMVVQDENFREMRLLIEKCRRWNVDSVRFYRLRQWGTYSAEAYQSRDIVNPLHRRHRELLAELGDPVFSDPIVYPWDLHDLIEQARRLRQGGDSAVDQH